MKKSLNRFLLYVNSERGKINLSLFFIVLAFVIIVVRLFDIQILEGEKYRRNSYKKFYKSKIITAKRGNIFDKNFNNLTYTNLKNKIIYPLNEHLFQVIGRVGKSGDGMSGLQLEFNKQLKGTDGWQSYDKFNLKGVEKKKIDGDNLILTIDKQIQIIVDEELERGIKNTGAVRGAVIVSNPKNGEILAMSSYPFAYADSFNAKAMKNLAISFAYEPGSVLKVLPATIALENYIFSVNDLIPNTENRKVKFYDRTFTDHETTGNRLTFKECLMHSSNVGFTTIASKIEPRYIWEYAIDFGLGKKTNIELPGEEKGYVKRIGTSQWGPVTPLSMSIGYGLLATPIQILTIYNTIANDGYRITPHIVKEIRDSKNEKIKYQYKIEQYDITKIASRSTFKKLKSMLQAVVDSGTSKLAKIDGVSIAGKTGTSEKSTSKGYSTKEHNTTFVGFLPVDDPMLSCIVVLDSPDEKHKFASNSAVPIFRNIIKRILLEPSLIYNEKIRISEKEKTEIVPNFIGLNKKEVENINKSYKFKLILSGKGKQVVKQIPNANVSIPKRDKVVLFFGDSIQCGSGEVGNYIGKSSSEAVSMVVKSGYVPVIKGNGVVVKQSPSPRTDLDAGREVLLYCEIPGREK